MNFRKSLDQIQRSVKAFLQPQEFTEIWKAALESLEEKAQVISIDRRILPFNDIEIAILAGEEQRRAWTPLLSSFDPTPEAATQLREWRIEIPIGFRVRVHLADSPTAEWSPDAPFHVTVSNVERQAARPKERSKARELSIELGKAGKSVYKIQKPEVCIGRCQTVQDRYGRMVRRNDIYFEDDQSEINSSVSQQHARILERPETGDLYLLDDSSANGTQIFRSGRVIPVPPGETGGVRLRDGDEIFFGKAMARYRNQG